VRPTPRALGHLLVVDDNKINQMVALGILSGSGWTADVVADGRAAIAAVERGGYAAVLMDCQMPVMDGYTATAEIRRRERPGERIPIIAMTASAVEGDRERCLAAGMDDYVSKPVTPASLDAALGRWANGERSDVNTSPAGASEVADPHSTGALGREARIRHRLTQVFGPEPDDVDQELAAQILRSFTLLSQAQLDDLQDAVRSGAADVVAQHAHNLKGSAANIGADTLAQMLECIELRSRLEGSSGDPVDLDPIRAELQAFSRSAGVVLCELEATRPVPSGR
jgi:CheY-like chemotaxis protein/HPt (histidine-containing phosphotransfer) domain-containing protein